MPYRDLLILVDPARLLVVNRVILIPYSSHTAYILELRDLALKHLLNGRNVVRIAFPVSHLLLARFHCHLLSKTKLVLRSFVLLKQLRARALIQSLNF